MRRVVVVTDTTATIPKELLEALDIRVVPLILNLGGRSYLDGIDMTPDVFYRLMRTSAELPKTSSPSIGDFLRVYAAAGKDAASILSIHPPANLTALYTTALRASEMLDGPHIQVIDSRTVSMAQGFVVLGAARKAAQGASLVEAAERAREIAGRVQIYVMLDTLEYLRRGGRIGDAAALLGGLLQIKPVVYVLDGQVKPLAKPRTREKGMECILKQMEEEVTDRPVNVAIVQADAIEEAVILKQQVAERFDCRELYLTEFTPVMGAHSGPGILGVAFYVDNR